MTSEGLNVISIFKMKDRMWALFYLQNSGRKGAFQKEMDLKDDIVSHLEIWIRMIRGKACLKPTLTLSEQI